MFVRFTSDAAALTEIGLDLTGEHVAILGKVGRYIRSHCAEFRGELVECAFVEFAGLGSVEGRTATHEMCIIPMSLLEPAADPTGKAN